MAGASVVNEDHTAATGSRSGLARLPMIVRTLADLEALRDNPTAVRRLPPRGLPIAMQGLAPELARRLERRLAAYVGACGCAEGAAAAMLGIVATLASVAVRIAARGPRWADVSLVAIGLFLAILLGGLGKLLGLISARARFEWCCRDVIRAHRDT